jgi:hypothetical protein
MMETIINEFSSGGLRMRYIATKFEFGLALLMIGLAFYVIYATKFNGPGPGPAVAVIFVAVLLSAGCYLLFWAITSVIWHLGQTRGEFRRCETPNGTEKTPHFK